MRATQVRSSLLQQKCHRPLYAGDPFFFLLVAKLGRPDPAGRAMTIMFGVTEKTSPGWPPQGRHGDVEISNICFGANFHSFTVQIAGVTLIPVKSFVGGKSWWHR
jgi:hypothetical protein